MQIKCLLFCCCSSASLFPLKKRRRRTDRTVISSRSPSSPSPRAHKSRRSAVTSARSWMALRLPLYPHFPRRNDTSPPLLTFFFLFFPIFFIYGDRFDVSFTRRHGHKTVFKTRGCLVLWGQVESWTAVRSL